MQKLLNAFGEYLRHRRRLSENTIKRYVDTVEKFIFSLSDVTEEAVNLCRLATHETVATFLEQAARTKAGVQSDFKWNLHRAGLTAFYEHLINIAFLIENPVAAIERHDATPNKRIPLDLSEFITLLRTAEHGVERYRARNAALFQVGLHCAPRVSELHRLSFRHLDFHNGLLVNLRTKGPGGGKFITIPFPPVVEAALRRCIAERERFGPAADEDAIYLSDRGTRLSVRQIQEIYSQHGVAAGFTHPFSPHILRHSAASIHAALGTDPYEIQMLLGHESLDTTLWYIHLMRTLRKTVNKLGEIVEAEMAASGLEVAPRATSACPTCGTGTVSQAVANNLGFSSGITPFPSTGIPPM